MDVSLEEKLSKIRQPHLEGQKHVRNVLNSIEETLRDQKTALSPTAYFAASLALLKQIPDQKIGDDIPQATVYLLDLITSHVSAALLRAEFGTIINLLAPYLNPSVESAPLLRSTVGCLESILLAQDSPAWALPQSQIGPRQAMAALLNIAIDHRPKVRKRAQDALCNILKHPPPGPAIDHPAAEACAVAAQNNLKNSVELVQKAKRQKGRPDDSHEPALVHALQLTKVIATASGGWPSKRIEQLCELLLSISRSRNEYLVVGAFDVFEIIFESMQDEVASFKLPRLLDSIVELKPTQNDSQLLPPWIAIVSRGYGTAADIEPDDTFAKLPELFDMVADFLASPLHNIRISASECLISFFVNCIPDSVIRDPSVYDEKVLEQLAKRASGLLAVKYQKAWVEVLKTLSALFDALRWRGDPYLLPIVISLDQLRSKQGFQGKTQVDEVLGTAIRNLGPASVLEAIPHNLIQPTTSQPGRAWLLPLLREYVSNTYLGHFVSDMIPLSEAMFQRVLEHDSAEKTMDIKIFETVVHQVWATFPGYCELPLDVTRVFDQQLAELVSNLLYQQMDLRVDICRGLQNLVESNQMLLAADLGDDELLVQKRLVRSDVEASLKHMSAFAGNLLAVLFNVYSQTLPQSRGYILSCINAYLSITPEEDLIDTFNRVAKMLESELPDNSADTSTRQERQGTHNKLPPTSHTLMDLIIASSAYLPRSTFSTLFGLARLILTNPAILKNDPQLIKKAYKLIPRLSTSEDGAHALTSRHTELQQLILITSEKTPVPARRDRLLAIGTLIDFLPVSDLHFVSSVISEIVLACKDSNEKARNAGFELLMTVLAKVSQSPSGTVIRNSLVPGMPADSPDAPATIEEVFSMVSAGLAGVAPHVVAASVTALSRMLWECHDKLNGEAEKEIVNTVLMFIDSNSREIIRAVLGFVKVIVVRCDKAMLDPKMPEIVKGMMMWSKENKGRLRQKVRGILERCLRRWPPDEVESWVGVDDRKMIVNIRKRKERSRRKKRGDDYEVEDEGTNKKYDNEFDEAVYGSDDDSEIEGSDDDSAMRGVTIKPNQKQQYIRQDDDDEDPLDLLDPRSIASITTKKSNRLSDAQNKRNHTVKTNDDGKLILADSDDDALMENDALNGVDAYLDAVSGPDAVRKGQKGKLKIKSGQRKSPNAVDLDQDEGREVARHISQSPRLQITKRPSHNARRGLGAEKNKSNPQVQKFRGGRGIKKRGVQLNGRRKQR